MNTQIKISGKILAELSEKIPTNIIALNELIKNSYDAGASFVTIEINTIKKILRIIDDGSGMTRKDIDMLFHISESNKVHGKKNKYGRITQGSKGLGFLSVFKFGKIVEWKTKSDKGYYFSVDFNMLTNAEDISHYPIELYIDDSISKGTEINIKIDNYNAKSLNDYFSLEKNYKKIINSFDDDKFIINLKLNNEIYSSKEKKHLLENDKKQQLFYVTYNCKTQKIIFTHNDHIIHSVTYDFLSNQYTLDIELLIFQLKSHGKENIDKLFFNPNDDLTPLIYYNSNLFINYTIFDPDIMRNIRNTQVLNQMIGFIRITSKNRLIDFNSDRSQFLQNELTDSIVKFLYDINRKIQETGSEMKNHLVKFDFLTENEISHDYSSIGDPEEYRNLIKDDFFFKKKVEIAVYDNNVTYSLFGKTVVLPRNDQKSSLGTKNKNLLPAKINLNCKNDIDIFIHSGQKNLKDYVDSVYNSDGEFVDKGKLVIKADGQVLPDGILSSEESPCVKNIIYSYFDSKTNIVSESVNIHFIEPSAPIISKKKTNLLLVIPSKKDYIIDLSQYISNLVDQINVLDVNKNKEIIACSLRALFELSIDCINKSGKYPLLFENINELDDKVVKIIEFVKSKKKYISEIAKNTKIDYRSLENFLDTEEFKNIIIKSHLGSHKSTMYIEEPDIRKIAQYAVYFIVFTNEMIHNQEFHSN